MAFCGRITPQPLHMSHESNNNHNNDNNRNMAIMDLASAPNSHTLYTRVQNCSQVDYFNNANI